MTDTQSTYRGWNISYDAKPIPVREFDWTATHPDYDPTPLYSGDPPSDDRYVHAATFEGLIVEVDRWIEENPE